MSAPKKGDLFTVDWDEVLDPSVDVGWEPEVIQWWSSVREVEGGTVYRVGSTRKLRGSTERFGFFRFRSRPDGTYLRLSMMLKCPYPKMERFEDE